MVTAILLLYGFMDVAILLIVWDIRRMKQEDRSWLKFVKEWVGLGKGIRDDAKMQAGRVEHKADQLTNIAHAIPEATAVKVIEKIASGSLTVPDSDKWKIPQPPEGK